MKVINNKSVKRLSFVIAIIGLVGSAGHAVAHGMMGMGQESMNMGRYNDRCPDMMDENMMNNMNPGMVSRHRMVGPNSGMGMRDDYRSMSALNLNEQQEQKILDIQDEWRKNRWQLMGQLNDERIKLRQLYNSDKRDADKIDAQQQRIFDLQRKLKRESIDIQNRMDVVLAPEQKDRIRSYGGWSGIMRW
ncbi:MAG: Spy/CpxP family protein refolding chaperone [Gammaproteobacteria bacterium]|nr:Spy/CpxP family protein refolding chaperone [Gammaproteobacteria bacterium]